MSDRVEVATDLKRESEETELLKDVRISMKQIDEGRVVSNREAKAELRKRFAR